MGLFDNLLKNKKPVRKYNSSYSSTRTKPEPVIQQSPTFSLLTEKKETETDQEKEKKQKKEEPSLKVTDTSDIEDNTQLQMEPLEEVLILYCPIRFAKIYCHSILIDKLGDLTKFIIESLHKGHTIEEICELTKMGSITIKEELDYLIRGGLVSEDRTTLSELGEQYGVLLERFESLSDGIDVAYNVFAEKFEPIELEKYIEDPDDEQILNGQFIPVLARKDNYKNSLDVAEKQITSDIPFCREIRNSLYATVKIEKTLSKHKPVYIRDFGKGYMYKSEPCITVALPCDRVSCVPRYKWVDPYRNAASQIASLADTCPEMLSKKAKKLIDSLKEESDAEMISKDINTITGEVNHVRNELVELQELINYQPVYELERRPAQLLLESDECKDVYLQEIERKELYLIRYFTYDRMEV